MMKTQRFKDDISCHFEAQIAELARDLRDLDACVELWRTVIEKALADLRYLQEHQGRVDLKKHQREKLRRIEENPPSDFLDGDWFEQICDYLQIDADRVRTGLAEQLPAA